jgi:hypothetical protein
MATDSGLGVMPAASSLLAVHERCISSMPATTRSACPTTAAPSEAAAANSYQPTTISIEVASAPGSSPDAGFGGGFSGSIGLHAAILSSA